LVGNESWNRYVFRRLQKTGSVGADVTSCGKHVGLVKRNESKR